MARKPENAGFVVAWFVDDLGPRSSSSTEVLIVSYLEQSYPEGNKIL